MEKLGFFEFQVPTRILFEENAVAENLGRVIELIEADKALLVTDAGVVSAGLCSRVEKVLNDSDMPFVVYDKVIQDPDLETVHNGLELAKQEKCGFVLGLGGGSALDAAKTIALLLTHGGEVTDYEGIGVIPEEPLIPLVGIPTTAGTGSEVTMAALITDKERGEKISLFGHGLSFQTVIVDPVMTVTMPPAVTAATGMDVLTHAVESVVSLQGSPLVEALSLKAITLVAENLKGAVSDAENMEFRTGMALASVTAGICIRHAVAGAAHSMAHAVGAQFHVPHGLACGMFLPDIMEFNLDTAPEKYALIAAAMGLDVSGLSPEQAAQQAIEAVRKLYSEIGLPQNLAEFGVKSDDIPNLAQIAICDGCVLMNPRPCEPEDFEKLFTIFI